MASNESLPLSGVRVLDVATMLAAPFCATLLGEFGADVVKIELPGKGDGFRQFGSMAGSNSYNWLNENRNKKSITLDLREREGKEIFRRLIADCDILVENFRPGTMERWGLGYEELKRIKADLILVQVTGYGQTGPNRNRISFARLAHAFSGFAHATGEASGPPLMPGALSLGDYVAGLYATIGALLAYTSRTRGGGGQAVDISLFEGMFRLMDEMATVYDKTGFVRQRMGAEVANAVPHSHYETQDGKWVALSCPTDAMFARLAEVMGRLDFLKADAFVSAKQRIARRNELNGLIADWTKTMSRSALIETALASGLAISEVYDIADIFEDPHFRARETFIEIEDPRVGKMVSPNVLPRLSQTAGTIRSLGPELGQHNIEIYRDRLGMSESEIERLTAAGVI